MITVAIVANDSIGSFGQQQQQRLDIEAGGTGYCTELYPLTTAATLIYQHHRLSLSQF
jgi:hypothetical protein